MKDSAILIIIVMLATVVLTGVPLAKASSNCSSRGIVYKAYTGVACCDRLFSDGTEGLEGPPRPDSYCGNFGRSLHSCVGQLDNHYHEGWYFLIYEWHTSVCESDGRPCGQSDCAQTMWDHLLNGVLAPGCWDPENEGDYADEVNTDCIYHITSCSCPEPPPPGGGGCPYLFTPSDQGFTKENNLLPLSELSNGEDVEDFCKIENPLVPGYQSAFFSLYPFEIQEFERENDFIDKVRLLAVDHDPDLRIAVTQEGEIVTYKQPTQPLSCVDNNGTDQMNEIRSMDGNLSYPSTYFDGYPGDALVMNFGHVKSGNGKLILRTDMKKVFECIDVQVKDGTNSWQTVEVLVPRDLWSIEVVDLSQYIVPNEDLMVRLFWRHHHGLDYVGLDTTPNGAFHIHTATLVSAIHQIYGNVRSNLMQNDQHYVTLVPGQQVQLTFMLPNNSTEERSFIFYTEGHYIRP